MNKTKQLQTAVFGSGCFRCAEAIFGQLKGIVSVTPGYAGGHAANPTYQQVCSDTTGHAEVVKIEYDPSIITYHDLLEIFWQTHDPTTPNRQGNDIGSQYRSVIFYADEQQMQEAQSLRSKLEESKAFPAPIVTEILPLGEFYPAEEYHHNYFARNQNQPYCRMVISPKVAKLKKKFGEKTH